MVLKGAERGVSNRDDRTASNTKLCHGIDSCFTAVVPSLTLGVITASGRMALGAPRGSVVWMVLREAFVLAAAGLAISVPTALGVSKLLESFLFGMKANDPLALTAAVVILVSAALLAGYFPARKASRIDPAITLRHE